MLNNKSTIARRRLLAGAAAGITSLLPVTRAMAAEWPDKPMRMLVGYPGGSGIDTIARQLARQLEIVGGQPVIVDNRPGALGNIAASAVAAAKGDPNTLLFTPNSTHAANIHLFRKLPFDPKNDFTPVGSVATLGFMLVVDPAVVQATNLTQLIQAIKKDPGKWAYGSGNATGLVAGALFKNQANVDVLSVPYKGVPQAMTDMLGGRIQMVFADATLGIPMVRSGKLRAIAVTSKTRMAALPLVPTFAESGLPNYNLTGWFAVFQPAGVPPETNTKLAAMMQRALREPSTGEFFRNLGAEPDPSTQAELMKRVNDDTEVWGKLVKMAGIEPE